MKYWYDKEFCGIICEPNCVDEWLELLWDIGIDYDGCNTVESLKSLVDELMEMSTNARKCLHDGKLFTDKEESERSYKESHEERKRWENAKDVCSE